MSDGSTPQPEQVSIVERNGVKTIEFWDRETDTYTPATFDEYIVAQAEAHEEAITPPPPDPEEIEQLIDEQELGS